MTNLTYYEARLHDPVIGEVCLENVIASFNSYEVLKVGDIIKWKADNVFGIKVNSLATVITKGDIK